MAQHIRTCRFQIPDRSRDLPDFLCKAPFQAEAVKIESMIRSSSSSLRLLLTVSGSPRPHPASTASDTTNPNFSGLARPQESHEPRPARISSRRVYMRS